MTSALSNFALLHRLARGVAAVIAFSAAPAFAHDLWIEPTSFFPERGQTVGVRLRVGQDLVGDALLRDPALVKQFVVVDAAGRRPVAGRDGDDPAGYLQASAPGLHVIGYSSHPSSAELSAQAFNTYLQEEGLDAVAALRAHRNQTGAGARELFSRCAKSLVLSGVPNEAQRDRPLGFTLELVAERNPYVLRAGQELPVRLTYRDRPLAGARVVAFNRLNPSEKLSARTDADGRVRFRLNAPGTWLVKTVHTIPAVSRSADWESYWASLTFELPAPKARTFPAKII